MQSKRTRLALIISVAVVVSLMATWIIAGPAQAALGNRGIPVYGRLSGPVPESESRYVKFYAADGSLTGQDAVPAGKYLLVTDIVYAPDGGSVSTNELLDMTMYLKGTAQFLRLRSTDNATQSMHFSTPIFVLEGGQQLEVTAAWFSENWGYVQVSGLLVDNITFLPVVIAN